MIELATNLLSFILIISIIVFAHEFGHYIVAKKCGVKINIFSLGFGRELFGFTDKSGTRWKFSMVPLGGYVKMHGDLNAASIPDYNSLKSIKEPERAFPLKPLWQKSLIVAAGPGFNYLLAIVAFFLLFAMSGIREDSTKIDFIKENSAAQRAGLEVGDAIIAVNQQKVKNLSEISYILQSDKEIKFDFTVERKDQLLSISIKPDLIEIKHPTGGTFTRPQIGISSTAKLRKVGMVDAFTAALVETEYLSREMLLGLWSLVSGSNNSDPSQIGGPIAIAKLSGLSVQAGFAASLWMIGVLSLNLGLINLLPIPILDGGHLLYYLLEAINKKPLSEKATRFGFSIGIAFVVVMMMTGFFNDIKNLEVFK